MLPDLGHRIFVEGVSLQLGRSEIGQIRLMKYQEDLLNAKEKIIAVDAPTGAGKTLAAALKAYSSMRGTGIAIFVYPTNALIQDQAKSIERALKKCHVRARVLDPSRPDVPDTDVLIAPVTSASLDQLASSLDVKTHGEALHSIRSRILPKGSSLFLLTNPEIIYILLKGHPRFKLHKSLIREFLQNVSMVIFDEFHLYFGFALANLISFMHFLWDGRKVFLLLSATPSLLDDLVVRRGGIVIRARPSHKGRRIRHESILYLKSLRDGPLWGERAAEELKNISIKLLDWAKRNAPDSQVRVLILVNSVVFAERLYDSLKENINDVARVHGFIPEKYRIFEADILIGTRALDVGIDFDAATVVFEALSSADFIQRMGRGARKRFGLAVALTKGADMELMSRKLPADRTSYHDLLRVVREVLPAEESYWGKVVREVGTSSLLALVHGMRVLLEEIPQDSVDSVKEIERSKGILREFLEEDMGWLVYNDPKDAVGDAINLLRLKTSPNLLISLVRSGMRGEPLPLRAYFKEFGTWGQIDVTDLWRVEFHVCQDKDGVYVEIEKPALGRPPEILLYQSDGPSVLKNFTLRGVDPPLREELEKLLRGVIYRFSKGRPRDWRIPAFVGKRAGSEGWVVIGPNALLGG
ncbi:MAG: type I-D CRISPR-associated helicase Cas3' [Candidatus Korarchaeota archaeon]|nr:type I-D CRISPR-associated helicase Cas3' [Candidatus Korarchaeota archaeon]